MAGTRPLLAITLIGILMAWSAVDLVPLIHLICDFNREKLIRHLIVFISSIQRLMVYLRIMHARTKSR